MRRGALTLSQVLEEEYEYVSGKAARCPETEAHEAEQECWRIRPHEIVDPKGLHDEISTASDTSYFAVLKNAKIDEAREVSEAALRQALADQMNELLKDPDLARRLMVDRERMPKLVLQSSERCAALLELPATRAVLIETGPCFESLLDDREKRTAVADELAGGDELRAILAYSAVLEVIRKFPFIFSVMIDHVLVREKLAKNGDARKALIDFFTPPPKKKKKSGVTTSAPPDESILRKVSQNANALRALINGEPLEKMVAALEQEPSDKKGNGLSRGNALMLEAAFEKWIGANRAVTAILRRMHQEKLPAICLSGGGIRSATFNLGILQALARRGTLSDFKYLSTVSGGGYIGAWLSSWIRRHDEGAAGTFSDLGARTGDPIDPEPPPMGHLRDYSRYLAPRAGLFTVDLWTIVAIYLRNLLLNWTLLLPPLFALLLLPRFAERWLMGPPRLGPMQWIFLFGSLLTLSMILFANARPKIQVVAGSADTQTLRAQRRRTLWQLSPIVATAIVLALGIGWHLRHGQPGGWGTVNQTAFAAAFFIANILGAFAYVYDYGRALLKYDDRNLNRLYRTTNLKRALFKASGARIWREITGALLAATVALALFKYAFLPFADMRLGEISAELFICLSVPAILMIFVIEGAVLLGVTTVVSSEHEREWVARAAAIVILAAIGWLLVTGTALLVPIALYQSPAILSALGGLSGLAALLTGKSAKTAANVTTRETTAAGRSFSLIIGTAATICLIVIFGAISMIATELLSRSNPANPTQPPTRASRIAVSTVLAPDGASDYNIKVTTTTETSMWTLGPSARKHLATLRGAHRLRTYFVAVLILMLATSLVLDVNTYSMHSMYRNRLVRAYLGASRSNRRPHPFTGFDPQDDLQMHQLRPELLWSASFRDFEGFLRELHRRQDLWQYLPKRVQDQAAALIGALPANLEIDEDLRIDEVYLQPIVFGALNDLLQERNFEEQFVEDVPTPKLLRANRAWLDREYAATLRPAPIRPPLHLISAALNLVGGDKLAWQQRKAESFTVSPLHTGAFRIGYRDTREYGGPGGISLGTATAISGAAVSPNMGYHSSGSVTALMTLFNARLGWWLGNPGPIGDVSYAREGPQIAIWPLLREALGITHDRSPWIFLSDGGHFENLGLYEMVLRRCKYIIVCDATADDKYAFGDLGNAVRKIRIDLGIAIDFDSIHIERPDPKDPSAALAKKYCALGRIRYGAIDDPTRPSQSDESEDGWLLYIKPMVYDDCPVDIRNYRKISPLFPHESTGDQFFSETQFESYRALGSHCIDQILGDSSEGLSVDSFFKAARLHVRTEAAKEEAAAEARAEAARLADETRRVEQSSLGIENFE